ncbi:MAG: ABC transporter ATP-binding protein, partial [Sciscionella sp.]
FVAGFIGSPSMNFVPAVLENSQLSTPFGQVSMSEWLRRAVEQANVPREVIMGIRPEHFEDAALVESGKAGTVFSARIDVLESMGSDKFAHFTVEGEQASSAELEELAADAGSADVPVSGSQIVTRLSTTSGAREGQPLDIWVDTDKVHLFDPSDGRNLGIICG